MQIQHQSTSGTKIESVRLTQRGGLLFFSHKIFTVKKVKTTRVALEKLLFKTIVKILFYWF
jgi:hypothetical protein